MGAREDAARVTATTPAAAESAASAGRALAYALLGFTMVVWGGSFVAARALLAPTDPGDAALTPTVLAALRFVLAAALFAPVLLVRWRRERRVGAPARRLDRGDVLRLLGLGQLGFTVYFWLQYTGVSLTNAGIASILVVGLIPIATAFAARLGLGEALRPAHGAALALGLLGVVVVTAQRGAGVQFAVSHRFALGALCLIANAACFAIYSTLVRDLRARFDALTLTAGTTAAGALGLIVLAAATGGWQAIGALSARQWLAVVYLALVCSVLAYFCYNRALAVLEAGRAATWVYLEPPVALLLGALLLGEQISPASLLGGAIIAAAVWVVSRAR
ncbi:MAG TPA: DMT family transporter [Thermomicrobiales bacterium]|nr:DMT family transporter [Thermomicrobiales bacterium]